MQVAEGIAAGLRRVERPELLRVALGVGALALLTLAGTAAYMALEPMGFRQALFMAVITLSTVGYAEVQPLSPAGQYFTIGFIVVGVGTTFYVVVALAEFLIAGQLADLLGRRSMDRTIQALRDHVIVCGYGRLGREVVVQLERAHVSVVIVDQNPGVAERLRAAGRACIAGSALEDEALRAAGIERARALVAATPSDADNVFIALSARELHPGIAIHARAETEAGTRRLHLAGAEQVIALHGLGGQRIAQAIVRPAVVDFIELATPGVGSPIDLEEVELSPESALVGRSLGELGDHGLRVSVVAIKRLGRPTRLNPGPGDGLEAGDHVVVVGDRDNLRRLAQLAVGASA